MDDTRLEDQGLTEAVAAFVADTPRASVPKAALESAKGLIIDTIGVSLASANRKIGRIVTAYVAEAGATPASASVLGGKVKTSPQLAALANGTLSHALVLDSGNHQTTHIVPAALAVAEDRGLSGADLMDAVVIGFEVSTKITQAVVGGAGGRGWWHPGLVGPLAGAVTAGRLLKFSRDQIVMALGIASCSSGGFRRNMGSMSQALHSGQGARDGIQAAILAGMGFTADSAILESPLGYIAALCQDDERAKAAAIKDLGKPYVLAEWPGVKPYPVCTPGQPLIDLIRKIQGREKFSADDVESTEGDLHDDSLIRTDPRDENEAPFSSAYLMAATLIHGDFFVDQVSGDAMHDPKVRAMMKRIKHVPAPVPGRDGRDRVVIRLKDGRAFTEEMSSATRRDMAWEDMPKKFRRCAEPVLPKADVDEFLGLALKMEQQPKIDRMMALVRGA
jgi:2-methylcitrate dehydratase PrpD